ncbi:DUF4153 domain-containing protein [Bacteroidia bacterium]|nr:DUF4153 domain-containing protein [Bacteroidia bacterium]
MKKFFSLASLSEKFVRMVQRMPVSVLLIIGLAVLLFTEINCKTYDVLYQSWIFCPVGLLISITAILWLEDHVANSWLRQGLTAFCVALWGVYCLLLPAEEYLLHFAGWFQIVAIGVVFGFALFFISFLGKNKDRSYWRFSTEIIYQLAVSLFFGLILLGGLCLAVLAIDVLFNVNMSEKVYQNLWVGCMILFAPLYFLSNVPDQTDKHRTEIIFPKLLRILGLYILMPILAVYAIILYAYLIRIVIAWELPNGWVSWLVSALAVGSLFVITLLYPMQLFKNRFVTRFSHYAGLFILPLLVLMSIGIVRRISDYGITINRLYILLLNIWFYGIYIYLYLSKSRHIKWILISPAVIFLLVSVGPWKFSSITRRVLTHKMETVLNGRQFVFSDSLLWLNDMKKEQKVEIRETLDYLADTYGKESIQPFFGDSIQHKTMYKIFAQLHLNNLDKEGRDNRDYFSYKSSYEKKLDIAKYQSYIAFNYYQNNRKNSGTKCKIQEDTLQIRVISDNRSFSVPLKAFVLSHIDTTAEEDAENPILFQTEDYLVCISDLHGNYYTTQDSINISSVGGILFYK